MAKYKIVKVKKGKKSVRKITSKNEMYDNLIVMQYDPRIAEELSGIWAEHVNGAYRIGLKKGLAGENGGYVPRSDCKPLSVYDHDEIYIGNGKGTSTPFGPNSINILDVKKEEAKIQRDRLFKQIDHDVQLIKKNSGGLANIDNHIETKIHTHIFCPVPLLQFIEILHTTIKMKGILS